MSESTCACDGREHLVCRPLPRPMFPITTGPHQARVRAAAEMMARDWAIPQEDREGFIESFIDEVTPLIRRAVAKAISQL